MTMMTGELLIIVIPIVVVEVILAILALLGIHRMYGCRNGNKTVWTVIVPVSYTHLDVYKRQY